MIITQTQATQLNEKYVIQPEDKTGYKINIVKCDERYNLKFRQRAVVSGKFNTIDEYRETKWIDDFDGAYDWITDKIEDGPGVVSITSKPQCFQGCEQVDTNDLELLIGILAQEFSRLVVTDKEIEFRNKK